MYRPMYLQSITHSECAWIRKYANPPATGRTFSPYGNHLRLLDQYDSFAKYSIPLRRTAPPAHSYLEPGKFFCHAKHLSVMVRLRSRLLSIGNILCTYGAYTPVHRSRPNLLLDKTDQEASEGKGVFCAQSIPCVILDFLLCRLERRSFRCVVQFYWHVKL